MGLISSCNDNNLLEKKKREQMEVRIPETIRPLVVFNGPWRVDASLGIQSRSLEYFSLEG